jgi:hypothetical protein
MDIINQKITVVVLVQELDKQALQAPAWLKGGYFLHIKGLQQSLILLILLI